MADFVLDCDDSSKLLCDESNDDVCFDDLDGGAAAAITYGGFKSDDGYPIADCSQESELVGIRVPVWCDDAFAQMLERESLYMPKEDYLRRLRSGELDLNFRREAFDWISKAHTHYCFGPLSFCLSMNYFDRFLSLSNLPSGKAWAVQLLSVACLSIAVKMEETDVPPSIELQVAEPKFLFEAKTIKRMELLVLITLKWQMNALTPCSFLDYFLNKITKSNPIPPKLIKKSIQVILKITKGLHFLEFKPSELAAAVAVFVAEENQSVNIDKAISSSSIHLQKVKVMKCVELIKNLLVMNKSGGRFCLPESPNGVLEAICFSNTTSDGNTTVGSHNNNSNKRVRLDHTISRGDYSTKT
ncbi:hypothetical protein V2J09_001949 [Rumex salicifolius]